MTSITEHITDNQRWLTFNWDTGHITVLKSAFHKMNQTQQNKFYSAAGLKSVKSKPKRDSKGRFIKGGT